MRLQRLHIGRVLCGSGRVAGVTRDRMKSERERDCLRAASFQEANSSWESRILAIRVLLMVEALGKVELWPQQLWSQG